MIPKQILSAVEAQMQKTLDKMKADFGTLRTGRANASLLENVRVDYYGAQTPLNQLANIGAPEARILEIRPWDKGAVQAIEKAIQKSELGLTPNNDGGVIRLQIPALTEERRKDLIKVVRKMAEEYRVAIRNERRDAVERLKKSEKAREITEDDRSHGEHEIQKMTDGFVKRVDDLLTAKERDIMEVKMTAPVLSSPAVHANGFPRELDKTRIPQHIAIIMDGNGRWAKQRHLPRVFGHRAGINSVRDIVRACGELGVRVLTLYAFSSENWARPTTEIRALMRLLEEYLCKELPELQQNNVQLRAIGRLEALPEGAQKELARVIQLTCRNTGLILNLALNYGGRQEIIDACNRAIEHHAKKVDEKTFRHYLYAPDTPDPDLLIRTSGEMRISNFLLWELAYTEFFITSTPWPEFRRGHLYKAIADYQQRERRFGGL